MSDKIKVLLVDDHSLFRSGIKSLLQRQEDISVIGEASDGHEGIKRAKELAPDIILMDLHMPNINGKEAIRLIKENVPNTKILMLTVSENSEDLIETLKVGAFGYLIKNIEADELLNAIRKTFNGESIISSQMTKKLINTVIKKDNTPNSLDKSKISPREMDILKYLAQGKSNKQIARELDLSESTVKIHVQNIFKKLNLTSRVQVALYAAENGLA